MKKIIIVAIVLLMTGCGCKKKETKITTQEQPKPIEEQVVNQTEAIQGDLQIYDMDIESKGSSNIVSGSIMNIGNNTLSGTAKIYLKNTDNQTLGIMETEFTNLGPGQFTQFSAKVMGDYTTVNTYKIVMENVR